MDIAGIKQTVSLYYQDPQALTRIWGKSSDFASEPEQNLASYLVSQDRSYLKKFANSKDFKDVQLNFKELKESLDLIPELEDYLNLSLIVPNYLKAVQDQSLMTIFPFKDFVFLFLQISPLEVKGRVDELTGLCLSYLLGDKKTYEEELATSPEPEEFLKKVQSRFKEMEADTLSFEDLTEQLLSGQDLKIAPEQFFSEHYQALVKSFILFPESASKNLAFFTKHKASLETLKSLWTPMALKILVTDLRDRFVLVKELESVSDFDSSFLETILLQNSTATVFLLQEKIYSQDQILESLLKLVVKFRQLSFFEEAWSVLKGHLVLDSASFHKMSAFLNNTRDPRLSQVWDIICREFVLDHMPRGGSSFSFHYPRFYEDVVGLDNDQLFYTEQDFVAYVKDHKQVDQEREILRDLAESLYHKIKIINGVLQKDLVSGKNSLTQAVFSDLDRTVLGAFGEKLTSAEKVLLKLVEKTSNPNFSVASLFYTQENQASFPNLKGFYLGELKVGGLENYEGHGVQLRSILEPLGFVLSAEIRKEIDHFVKIKENHRISLILVESKNFKKVLTRRSPRLFEVMNQKERLNESISMAHSQMISQDQELKLDITANLCLSRGLSKNTKKMLSSEEMYQNVQGIEVDFSQAESLVDESFQSLVAKIKRRMNENKALAAEFFEEDLHDLSNLIMMVEEDVEDQISRGKDFSQNIQTRVLIALKKYMGEFKEKQSSVKHIFQEFVMILSKKIQRLEQEEAV